MKRATPLIGMVIVLCLAAPAFGATFVHGWYLGVESLHGGSDRILTLEEDEEFHVKVKVALHGSTSKWYKSSITTRPKTLKYYLFKDWDGVDYNKILNGEVIGKTTVRSLKGSHLITSEPADQVRLVDKPTLIAPSKAGEYFVSACIPASGDGDLGRKVAQKMEIRCSDPVKLVVQKRARPDLVLTLRASSAVRRLTGDKDAVYPSGKINLSVKIANVGEANSMDSHVDLYLVAPSDNRNFIDPDTDTKIADTVRVPSIKPGSAVTKSTTVTAPPAAGSYRYGACIQKNPVPPVGRNSVSLSELRKKRESNLHNNCSRLATVDVVTPNAVADLVVLFPHTYTAARPGDSIAITATVKNIGQRASQLATLVIRQPENSRSVEVAVNALAPNETQEVTTGIVAPNRSGNYQEEACIRSKTPESDKKNNCATFDVRVE